MITNLISSSEFIVHEDPQAIIAAEFANACLMHKHRGVIDCDTCFVIFGNDGYAVDQRSRKEAAEVWGALKQHDIQFGLSSDGNTWAFVVTDHSQSHFDREELEDLVWTTWMCVCDQIENY